MWPYAWPVPGKLRQWAGSSLCSASRKRFRGRRRSGLRLWLGFRLGQRSRPGPGFRGRLRRYGFWLWLGFRRGRRPRPRFRRLRPWSGRRPRRRFRVRRPRHWRPLRLRDRRRLCRFGACRFRPCRFRLAGIAGYVARMNCGSAGEICCHPGILPGRAVTIRAAGRRGPAAPRPALTAILTLPQIRPPSLTATPLTASAPRAAPLRAARPSRTQPPATIRTRPPHPPAKTPPPTRRRTRPS